MAGIFISYRRDDSAIAAGRLAGDLSKIFGRDLIFRDIENLTPGEDYEKALDHVLDSCLTLIAVIGPQWSTITDKVGHRRLEDPTDWVKAEISRALVRDINVIPVLISGTIMPRDEEIPDDLKPLLKRQAVELNDRNWRYELERLAQAIEKNTEIVAQDTFKDKVIKAIKKLKNLEYELSAFDKNKMVYESQQNSRYPEIGQNPHSTFVKPALEPLLDKELREYLPKGIVEEIDDIIDRPRHTIDEVLIQITKIRDYLTKSH